MKLIMTVGAPGSGKSTFAKTKVKKLWKKGKSAAIFSKDDIRNMMSGSSDKQRYWKDLLPMIDGCESMVRNMLFANIIVAVRSGLEVAIIPDCHPTPSSVNYAIDRLYTAGVPVDSVEIYSFVDNTLEELLAINETRPKDDRLDVKLVTNLNNLCVETHGLLKKYASTKTISIKLFNQPKNPGLSKLDKETYETEED